jgi:hypothetical protein
VAPSTGQPAAEPPAPSNGNGKANGNGNGKANGNGNGKANGNAGRGKG